MGSLATLGAGSMEFATNSGSAVVDFATGMPGLLMNIVQLIGNGIADNITASVSNP
ncbi:hypothetical protein G6016_01470 [Dietzia aerolata]|uniref:Uncharacterized protein n=1 Tax=Dietzia aerolata TaxID=595984 RepID=A0ABV5JN90_9ACTN|nr:hypothetical protein [Dietzia aerolata]MBB0967649.1 hypothetical protein [Dietzia aerolata]